MACCRKAKPQKKAGCQSNMFAVLWRVHSWCLYQLAQAKAKAKKCKAPFLFWDGKGVHCFGKTVLKWCVPALPDVAVPFCFSVLVRALHSAFRLAATSSLFAQSLSEWLGPLPKTCQKLQWRWVLGRSCSNIVEPSILLWLSFVAKHAG